MKLCLWGPARLGVSHDHHNKENSFRHILSSSVVLPSPSWLFIISLCITQVQLHASEDKSELERWFEEQIVHKDEDKIAESLRQGVYIRAHEPQVSKNLAKSCIWHLFAVSLDAQKLNAKCATFFLCEDAKGTSSSSIRSKVSQWAWEEQTHIEERSCTGLPCSVIKMLQKPKIAWQRLWLW